jgi:polyhydroxyalkanoate synthase
VPLVASKPKLVGERAVAATEGKAEALPQAAEPAWPVFWPYDATKLLPEFGKLTAMFAPPNLGASSRKPVSAPCGPDGVELPEAPSAIDRLINSAMGRATFSVSPASLATAYFEWLFHILISPGKRWRLVEKAVRKATRFAVHASRAVADPGLGPCIEPLLQDHRFGHPDWQQPPFNFVYQWFLLNQQWWHNATTGVHGVSRHHEEVVSFVARQLLDTLSPSNFIPTNPVLLRRTLEEGGRNLMRGAVNWVEDWERAIAGRPPPGSEVFRPGREVAVTPGIVVYRNRLIELIQYAPTTPDVQAEPILIVPAWIMKYYILDLSPNNSLVKYLVERGHTVFMISWRNPGPDERDLGMEDYVQLGVLEAARAIQTIVPEHRINAVGYCLGGTLLAIAAALLARGGASPLNTVTLLAAQVDFTEAGELTLFIDEDQLTYLEDVMWEQGYLDTKQMAGAFQILRSNDLIWSRIVHDYLMGEREAMSDLMAWNADATRMPYRMHSEYLRRFFLDNALVEGRYEVLGRPVALGDIRVPTFAVSTEADHVAPWRSVYKLNLLLDTDLTFLLTSGGHNAGIVSEPGHPRRHYRFAERKQGGQYIDPETWFATTPEFKGSWWPVWADWLERHSSGRTTPPALGAPDKGYPRLGPAPGTYVLQA